MKAQRNKTEYVEMVMGPKCSHGYISKRPFLPLMQQYPTEDTLSILRCYKLKYHMRVGWWEEKVAYNNPRTTFNIGIMCC